MEEKLNLNQLLQKPIAMMTGEELCFLITKSVESTEVYTDKSSPYHNGTLDMECLKKYNKYSYRLSVLLGRPL